MKYFLFQLLLLLTFSFCWSQHSSLKTDLDIADKDGVFLKNEAVQTFLTIENTSNFEIEFTIKWSILTDDWKPLKTMPISSKIKSLQTLRMECPYFSFPNHGFYRIRTEISIPNEPKITHQRVIGIDPEKIIIPIDRKEDFYSFWENARKELSIIKPEYEITSVNREKKSTTNLYKVSMKSYQGKTVKGWLQVPKKKGVYPALLRVPGYQENLEPIDSVGDMIIFSFNTRDHGESDDSEGERSWDMWVRGLDKKENYYYKGLFLDCIRALDYLTTRVDIDSTRIAIWGGSQGGGLSFSTAALDHRIALCIADIPYMGDYTSYFEITYWQEISTWLMEHPESSWKTILNTLTYYDINNFAENIICPVWMGIGLQDDICPPSTSFSAFNRVTTDKSFTIYKNAYHEQPKSHYERRFIQLRQFFNRKK
jgi:cephalosporin-C deacetylase